MKRRTFIKTMGIAPCGTTLINDQFINLLAKTNKSTATDIIDQFSHTCDILRPDDLLYLRYYFVNLKTNRNLSKLKKINESNDAYFIVRIPQQHIGEKVIPKGESKEYVESFISGFSFLTFKLKKNQTYIKYDAKHLTNWNDFNLLTLQDLTNYPKNIPVDLSTPKKTYPIYPDNFPEELAVVKIGTLKIPVTLIEAPYKLFLSPISPLLRPERDTDYRYQFKKDNTNESYYAINSPDLSEELRELWSNDLVLQITNQEKGIQQLPPNFKIVAYEENSYNKSPDKGVLLLPNPDNNHRSKLAKLSNIPEDNRDIYSKYFNISSLGISTFLQYFNSNHTYNNIKFDITEWKQEIKFGRDNYVKIVEKAIDARSTLKVIAITIAERVYDAGKSYLLERTCFKYIEKEKEFSDPIRFNNFIFKKIIALEEGSFYTTSILNFIETDVAFIPTQEYNASLIIKMPYIGIDQNDNKHKFFLDLLIIREKDFSQNKVKVIDALKSHNNRIAANLTDDHIIKINKEKIGYAKILNDENANSIQQTNNTELVTEEIQFHSLYADEYDAEYPLIPYLKYAKVQIPQLEGIESNQKFYYVNYCKSYIRNGFLDANKTKVFLQTLKDTIPSTAIPTASISKVNNPGEGIFDELIAEISKEKESIKNVFSENYRNIGSIINPDIVIDNISVLKPSIVLTDELNDTIQDISSIRPSDILKGMNAQLFGAIKLTDILKKAIPMEDSPVFELIEEAKEGFAATPAYVDEYNKLKADIEDLPKQIKAEEEKLKDCFNEQIKSYVDKYFEKFDKINELTWKAEPILGETLTKTIRENEKELESILIIQTGVIIDEVKGITEIITANSDPIKQILAVSQIEKQIESKISEYAPNGKKTKESESKDADENLNQLLDLQSWFKQATLTETIAATKVDGFVKIKKALAHSIAKVINESNFKVDINNKLCLTLLLKQHINSLVEDKNTIKIDDSIINYPIGKDTTGSDIFLSSLLSLLKNEKGESIIKINCFTLHTDFDGWTGFLREISNLLMSRNSEIFKVMVEASNELVKNCEILIKEEKNNLDKEMAILQSQVSHEIKTAMDTYLNSEIKDNEKHRVIKQIYFYYQSVYFDLISLKHQAELLIKQLGAVPKDGIYEKLDGFIKKKIDDQIINLRTKLKHGLETINSSELSVGDLMVEEFRKALQDNRKDGETVQKILNLPSGSIKSISPEDLVQAINDKLIGGNFFKNVNLNFYTPRIDKEMHDILVKASVSNPNLTQQDIKRLNRALLEAIYPNKIQKDLNGKTRYLLDKLIGQIDNISFEKVQEYAAQFAGLDEIIKNKTNALYGLIDKEKQDILNQIEIMKQDLSKKEDKLKTFVSDKINELENQILELNKQLINAYQEGEDTVNDINGKTKDIKDTLAKIKAINKKEIRYTWETEQFEDKSLGLINFIKGKKAPTRLHVDIKNTILFDNKNFPPKIDKVVTSTDTSVSNFTLNFMGILSLEFDKVGFSSLTNGSSDSNTADRFEVAIRDVRFEGPLNFVGIIQGFLKTLDKGLRIDVSAEGATLGYDLALPDISGGAFNIVKAKLVMGFTLPFKAGRPMRFTFELNSPQNMFLVTAGIFGGRGCFQLALEADKGIVSVLLVIEFGGVLYLNLGVAEGIVYLFAGIYMKKEYDIVELRGYLTCGGALNIAGLITASVTFYMGLQNRENGKYLDGFCTISYEIKISRFFSINVGMCMYKRIHGSPDNSSTNSSVHSSSHLSVSSANPISLQSFDMSANPIKQRKVKTANEKMDITTNEMKISKKFWNEFFAANFHK